jgi:trans-aconitate 2-methyltransferase
MWSPDQYAKFGDERSRPFFDLLSRVRLEAPRRVVDLGCGPGELTAALLARWPGARVLGVDSSPEMLHKAQALAVPGRLDFVAGDLAGYRPDEPQDLVVANASLHWIEDHATLLGHLLSCLAPGGVLAFQVPANFQAPSHALLREVCAAPRWKPKLGFVAERDPPSPVCEPDWYLTFLQGRGLRPEVWTTTYYHVLQGEDAVLEWVSGTALRPVLARLDEAERRGFRAEYGARLREAYPAQGFGTVFPFTRYFVVAAS